MLNSVIRRVMPTNYISLRTLNLNTGVVILPTIIENNTLTYEHNNNKPPYDNNGDNIIIQTRRQTIKNLMKVQTINKVKLSLYASVIFVTSWYQHRKMNNYNKYKRNILLCSVPLKETYEGLSEFLGFHKNYYSIIHVDNKFKPVYPNTIFIHYLCNDNRKKKELISKLVETHLKSSMPHPVVARMLFYISEQSVINKVFEQEKHYIEKLCYKTFNVKEDDCSIEPW